MTTKSTHDSPILVTGAAGDIGAIGRHLTAMLIAKGHKVRALVRREDERAEGLRQLGEVVQGDLTDLTSMHRAIEGVARIYFGMSVSAAYLEATVNTAAVARYHGIEAFVNMSQMTVTQMSITETTPSPQHKLHWLAEQALAWSGLPVVTVRPTVFLEGFFLRLAAASVRDNDELALPLGNSKTSPISAVDVARAVSEILDDPAPHIGHIYNLTGFESADLDHYARVFSSALGRTIRYRNVPLSGWTDTLREFGVPTHLANHLAVMAELHAQGRYDRMTDDLFKLTGKTPTSMYDFVKLHAAEFTRTLATELLPRKSRVNAVSPGVSETPLFGKLGLPEETVQEIGKSLLQQMPMKRFGTVEEIAKPVSFLASDDASYITRVELAVDGGRTQL